jgi:hypothetical protein
LNKIIFFAVEEETCRAGDADDQDEPDIAGRVLHTLDSRYFWWEER